MSVMRVDCSAVMDVKEKMRLVYELYCKKLMFKCFMGWINGVMSVSEDEEEEVVEISTKN